MDPKITPKPIIFQRGNRISAEMVHFQIRNGPENRACSTENIDFQICNGRLEKCEPRFKIDHREFEKVHFTGRLLKKSCQNTEGKWGTDAPRTDARTDNYEF